MYLPPVFRNPFLKEAILFDCSFLLSLPVVAVMRKVTFPGVAHVSCGACKLTTEQTGLCTLDCSPLGLTHLKSAARESLFGLRCCAQDQTLGLRAA